LIFKRITVSQKALFHHVFHFFCEEMERIMSPISTTTRNLVLELVEAIAQSLKSLPAMYVGELIGEINGPGRLQSWIPMIPMGGTI
jgi:hypothetical protein